VEFMGYTNAQSDGGRATRFYFRRAGAAFGFSPEEWDALKRAFRQALRSPEMVTVLAELHLQYGDV
jgi:hypothetical protein